MDLNFRFPDAAVCRPRRKQGFFRPQHDEQLVQVQRTRRIAGSERDDAGNLPVDPGRDPHIAGSDFLGGDPEGGGHQRHELHIVAPYRLRAKTEIRQRRRLFEAHAM